MAWGGQARAASPNTVPRGAANVMEFGARGDGLFDDTAAIRAAHASGRNVHYPKPPRFYRLSATIDVATDCIGGGAEIRMRQDGGPERTMLQVTENSRPIRISGLILDGGYVTGSKGEFSHGVNLLGARDVSIVGNDIRNIYGDCIYVGSSRAAAASANITIRDNTLSNPRRCNIAIVCGERISVDCNMIVKRSSYVSAIDMEPNDNTFDFVRDVTISRNRFRVDGVFLYGTTARKRSAPPNTGLVVSSNRGTAEIFFKTTLHSNPMRQPSIRDNVFRSSSPAGGFLYWDGVRDATLIGNLDRTSCLIDPFYKSNRLVSSTVAHDHGNIFCRDVEPRPPL